MMIVNEGIRAFPAANFSHAFAFYGLVVRPCPGIMTAMLSDQSTDKPASFRRVAWFFPAILVMMLVAATALVFSYFHKHPIATAGGLYFFRPVMIAVPHFCQHDPRWKQDRLGWTDGTLGGEGCAVTASAMVLKYYGVDTDPQRLNNYLSATGGYTREGWIYWEAAANLAPGRVRKAYEDPPSFCLIDWNLIHGNPVIARVRLSGGITHFVVVTGKNGFDYLINDPMAEDGRCIYPLRELCGRIEALRFYEQIGSR